MDSTDALLLWILGGTGVTLLYAAYKGKSPLSVLTNHIAGTSATGTVPPAVPVAVTPAQATLDSHTRDPSYSADGSSYSVGMDANGTKYVYGANGQPLSVLPSEYDATPFTYIPPGGRAVI